MSTVYISDLDGTLLTDHPALSDYSRDALRELLEQGLLFTVATARSVVSARTMLDGLPLPLPIIEFNGAFISDLASGRHEIVHSIGPAVVEDLYHLIRRFGCAPFISSFNGSEDCVYYREILNEGMRWYLEDRLAHRDPRWRAIDDLTASFRDEIVCLTIVGEAGGLRELEAAVRERYPRAVETHHFENRYSPGWYWLTIHDHRATKDQAIRTLVETYDLTDRELVVFGDHSNDIKMFAIADRAIAVANATPELKQHATQIIGSNREDSVAKYLREDWIKLP